MDFRKSTSAVSPGVPVGQATAPECGVFHRLITAGLLRKSGAAALICAALLPAQPVAALGANTINDPATLGSCNVSFVYFMTSVDANDFFGTTILTVGSSSGLALSQTSFDGVINAPTPSTPDPTQCGFSDVGNAVIDTWEQPFDADDFYGFTFEATDPSDGNRYDYRIGFQGATTTTFVNTRTLVVARDAPEEQEEDTGPSVEEMQDQIASVMQSRARQVIAAQPDVIRQIAGTTTGEFNADVTQGRGLFDIATPANVPVWAHLQGSWTNARTAEDRFFFGAIGGHTNLSANTWLGLMVQFDSITRKDTDSEVEGTGYLVGPYLVAKMPDQPLYFEARLLTGTTENELDLDGARSEEYDTRRSLVAFTVAGQLTRGVTVFTPSVSAVLLLDTQEAFRDAQGRKVGEQKIEIRDLALGIDFAHPLAVVRGDLLLTGGLFGIWSESETSGASSDAVADTDGGRARLELGTRYRMDNGLILSAGGFYDGIGLDDYESTGLDLGIEMEF